MGAWVSPYYVKKVKKMEEDGVEVFGRERGMRGVR